MRIGDFDTSRRVLVVAEIGNNHEGDFALARELVRRAAAAGADAVKFQTYRTELFVRPTDAKRREQLRRFELRFEQVAALAELARAEGLLFIATPLDLASAAFLAGVCDALKVASGDNNFTPLLEQVAACGLPLIISGGMATTAELSAALATVRNAWQRAGERADADAGGRDQAGRLAVLHCVSAYPTPPEQANLGAIATLARELRVTVGYSDHAEGIEAAALSVLAGARIVEKHFTFDKRRTTFRDHALSAEPADMAELVRRIRRYELLLGSGQKHPQPCEQPGLRAYRRSIVAARDLPAGHVLRWEDLNWQRPGDGLAPGCESQVLGGRLIRPLRCGENITAEALERSTGQVGVPGGAQAAAVG